MPTLFKRAEGNILGGVFASRWGTPRGPGTQACTQILMRENREVPWSPVLMMVVGAGREGNA